MNDCVLCVYARDRFFLFYVLFRFLLLFFIYTNQNLQKKKSVSSMMSRYCGCCNSSIRSFYRHNKTKRHKTKTKQFKNLVCQLPENVQWCIVKYIHPCEKLYEFDRWIHQQQYNGVLNGVLLRFMFLQNKKPCDQCALCQIFSILSFDSFVYQWKMYGVCMNCICKLHHCTNWFSVHFFHKTVYVDMCSNRVYLYSYNIGMRSRAIHMFEFSERFLSFFDDVHMYTMRTNKPLPCTLEESWKQETIDSVETYIDTQRIKTYEKWLMFI